MSRLSNLIAMLRREKKRDPAVTEATVEALRHIRTNRQLLREIRAVQVQLERSSAQHQGDPRWRSTPSSSH